MKTTDLFKGNRSSQKLNEATNKMFGKKLNLESFKLEELQDARNKLRTKLSQIRTTSGFNENLENDVFHKTQWMLDSINAELAERSEHIVDSEEIAEDETTSEEEQGTEDMSKQVTEGEVQQASAIVTAKTMVDRISRWIEELSGMENDTMLQLGDSIRDEMGQEQAKQFISSAAPPLNSSLESLKAAREELSSAVRQLTGEESPMDMLGDEPGMGPDMDAEFAGDDEIAPADPNAMTVGPDAGDEFGAADAAAGGAETAGRMRRESIERGTNLMKILAG